MHVLEMYFPISVFLVLKINLDLDLQKIQSFHVCYTQFYILLISYIGKNICHNSWINIDIVLLKCIFHISFLSFDSMSFFHPRFHPEYHIKFTSHSSSDFPCVWLFLFSISIFINFLHSIMTTVLVEVGTGT